MVVHEVKEPLGVYNVNSSSGQQSQMPLEDKMLQSSITGNNITPLKREILLSQVKYHDADKTWAWGNNVNSLHITVKCAKEYR